MEFNKLRSYLADRGIVYLFSLYIAGYFLLPMAAGHRRLYYFLIFPAVVVLWRELTSFFRGNLLAAQVLLYVGWMMTTLLWTSNFDARQAASAVWYAVAVMSFVFVAGYIWVEHAERIARLEPRVIYLAATVALVSIVTWYLQNPFPESRLEPLGVMHHQNKSACAYGLFLLLCSHHLIVNRDWRSRSIYGLCFLILLGLVLFTQSRTALGAICIGLVVMFGYRALMVAGIGVAASFLLVACNHREWVERVETLSFRPGIWEQVWQGLEGHWLFGRGYLLDPEVQAYGLTFSHAHNGYLATLRDGGVVGLVLLVAMLLTALVWAWRIMRDTGERFYLALLLYAMVCISMDYDRLIVHPKELWLFFWLPVALVMAVYARRDNPVLMRFLGGS